MSILLVDVLPHLKTARFDSALSYRVPNGIALAAGKPERGKGRAYKPGDEKP